VIGNPFTNALRSLKNAAKLRDFWLLAASFFVCGATTNGLVGTHLVPACHDHGISEVRAAGLLATMGIFDLIGTTGSGWLSDRFDSRKLLFVYFGVRGVSLLYLPLAFGNQVFALPVFAVLYGLDWIATVPPTLRLTCDAVGPNETPVVFGWIVAGHQVGAGAGALAAGTIRTVVTTYTPAWISAGDMRRCADCAHSVRMMMWKPKSVSTMWLTSPGFSENAASANGGTTCERSIRPSDPSRVAAPGSSL
jgi:predicted MFS family arabinose efflux permease